MDFLENNKFSFCPNIAHLEVELCQDAGALACDQGAAGVAVILGRGRGPGDGGSQIPDQLCLETLRTEQGHHSLPHDPELSCHGSRSFGSGDVGAVSDPENIRIPEKESYKKGKHTLLSHLVC